MDTAAIQDVVFDDEAIRAMGLAFDCACQSLRPMLDASAVRESIAKQIIAAAKLGERDPLSLQELAIGALGLGEYIDVRSSVGRTASIPAHAAVAHAT